MKIEHKNIESENEIIITGENGDKKNGKILFTFEENGDTFILYELEENVYASKIDNEDNLFPVEDDEWKLIEKIYEDFIDKQEKSN